MQIAQSVVYHLYRHMYMNQEYILYGTPGNFARSGVIHLEKVITTCLFSQGKSAEKYILYLCASTNKKTYCA